MKANQVIIIMTFKDTVHPGLLAKIAGEFLLRSEALMAELKSIEVKAETLAR